MTSKSLFGHNCPTTKAQAFSAFKPTGIDTCKCKTLISHTWDYGGNMAEEDDSVKQGLQ